MKTKKGGKDWKIMQQSIKLKKMQKIPLISKIELPKPNFIMQSNYPLSGEITCIEFTKDPSDYGNIFTVAIWKIKYK